MTIYNSYNKTDKFYEFISDNGKFVAPLNTIILVDDDSDENYIAIKATATRKTIGLVKK